MSEQLATVELEQRGESLLVRVRGEVDLSNVERLEALIEHQAGEAPHVVIDLTEIEYIDSQGLRLLTLLSKKLGAGRAGALEVVAPPGSIARSVLDLTQMSGDLAVRDELAD